MEEQHHAKIFLNNSLSFFQTEPMLKICLIDVGKSKEASSLVNKVCKFKQQRAIGSDFALLPIQYHENSIRLQLWDFAGQARFNDANFKMYIKNSNCFVLIFNPADENAINSLEEKIKKIKDCTSFFGSPILIVGNITSSQFEVVSDDDIRNINDCSEYIKISLVEKENCMKIIEALMPHIANHQAALLADNFVLEAASGNESFSDKNISPNDEVSRSSCSIQ